MVEKLKDDISEMKVSLQEIKTLFAERCPQHSEQIRLHSKQLDEAFTRLRRLESTTSASEMAHSNTNTEVQDLKESVKNHGIRIGAIEKLLAKYGVLFVLANAVITCIITGVAGKLIQ